MNVHEPLSSVQSRTRSVEPLVGNPVTICDVPVPWAPKNCEPPTVDPTSSQIAVTLMPGVHVKVTDEPLSVVLGAGVNMPAGMTTVAV